MSGARHTGAAKREEKPLTGNLLLDLLPAAELDALRAHSEQLTRERRHCDFRIQHVAVGPRLRSASYRPV